MPCHRCQKYSDEEIGSVTALLAAIPIVGAAASGLSSLYDAITGTTKKNKAAKDPAVKAGAPAAQLTALVSFQGRKVTVSWLRQRLISSSNTLVHARREIGKIRSKLIGITREKKALVERAERTPWFIALAGIVGLGAGWYGSKATTKAK